MTTVVFAIPGDIDLPTGGYTYDRRVLALLPQHGVAAQHVELPAGYPLPTPADLDATARAFAGTPRDSVLMVDGLAYGAMPADVVRRAAAPIIALVHHPLCLETGLSDEHGARLRASETAALALAQRVIVTSRTTARTLVEEFAVPPDKLTIAEPGTDPAPRAPGSSGTLQLLAVGSVVPRKGYDILVRALEQISTTVAWQLTIVGATDRSPETTAAIETQIVRSPLASRIRMIGSLSERALGDVYARSDVLVLSSLYEGYGMVLAEALARGLPIVTTTGGAAAETVPDGAALKVPPADVDALADALQRVIADAALRQRLADAAWAFAQSSLPRWDYSVARIAAAIKELAR
jgi:glycosyltransferase involved in cell wall biosynthesis